MQISTSTMALAAVLGLAACGSSQSVSRNESTDRPLIGAFSHTMMLSFTAMDVVETSYNVVKVNVTVPQTLRVSEANSYVPMADIVWHGDPAGDRAGQVQALLTEAATKATKDMTSGPKVEVDLVLTRFHALTPKARYSTGGNFATRFIMTVRDVTSGKIIDGPRPVVADCLASGGNRAMQEESAGITQKSVVEEHVAKILAHELTLHLAPRGPVLAMAQDEVSLTDRGFGIVSRSKFVPGSLTFGR